MGGKKEYCRYAECNIKLNPTHMHWSAYKEEEQRCPFWQPKVCGLYYYSIFKGEKQADKRKISRETKSKCSAVHCSQSIFKVASSGKIPPLCPSSTAPMLSQRCTRRTWLPSPQVGMGGSEPTETEGSPLSVMGGEHTFPALVMCCNNYDVMGNKRSSLVSQGQPLL